MRGQGEVPNELFDPQFACSQEDFKFCKGVGKRCYSYQHGKHAADYKAYNRMAKGKAKGQSSVASQQLAAKASLFWTDVRHSIQTSCACVKMALGLTTQANA